MTPKSNYIFLTPIDKKVSTLIIPSKYTYRSKEFLSGKVHSIGSNINQVIVGDEIAYARDAGIEVEYNGEKFIVLKPKSILAVV